MAYYTIGGKNGQKVRLREAEDLVVVRLEKGHQFEDLNVSSKSRSIMDKLSLVYSFNDVRVNIYRVTGSGDEANSLRNAARAELSQEEQVQYAGRVLLDTAGNLSLYTEKIFVKFHDAVSEERCDAIIKENNLVVKTHPEIALNTYFLTAPDGSGQKVFEMSNALLELEEVEFCHPEVILQRAQKAIHSNQWHLKETTIDGHHIDQNVDVEGAWEITKGEGVVIAVIDDGVDVRNTEFSSPGKIVAPYDASLEVEDGSPKRSGENHGTACAGVACADGSEHASGVAPASKLMPIRLSSNLGSRSEVDAFMWAADKGAHVISCSWGPPDGRWYDPGDFRHTSNTPLPDSTRLAIDYATTKGRNGKGCIITWAAGNGRESVAFDGYAKYDKVLAIAACNDSGKRSVYSDFGTEIICAFPSGDFGYTMYNHPDPLTEGIWTTDIVGAAGYSQSDYTDNFSGTSSACPGAAGVVALMLSANPNLRLDDVKSIIREGCDKIDSSGGNYDASGHSIYYGYGRINAAKCVQLAKERLND